MKKISIVLILLLLLTGTLSGCGQDSGRIEVTTAKAKTESDVSDLTWTGTVQALKTVDVVPSSTGKVASIHVSEGQTVGTGENLFTLDSEDARLQVQQAQASLNAANVALSSAAQSASSGASVTPARIAYDDAKANYERIKALYDAGAASKVDCDSAKSKMDTAAASLESAKIGQNSSYDSAQAQVTSAKAALGIAEKRLSDCVVTSPMNGRIIKVNVEVGEFVSSQSPSVTVIDDSGEEVVIQVAETDVEQLAEGMPMSVQLQALGQTCDGSVSEIATAGDPKTGMFDVKVALDSPGADIQPGMTANVRLAGSAPNTAVYVPAKSVHEDSWLFVVKDGKAVKQEVTVGAKKNAYIEIKNGLSTGDEVVVQTSEELEDGTPVRVITGD